MNRRLILHLLAGALGFALGSILIAQQSRIPSQIMQVHGVTEGTFEDLKSKNEIADLPWISPSQAVTHCGIKSFRVKFASEGSETVMFPLKEGTIAGASCVFNLATYPSKYRLSFQLSGGEE